jgi:hypothetical protein
MDVVEKARDVEEEEGACFSCGAAGLGVVDDAQGGIDRTVVVAATKLMGVDEVG